MRELVLVFITIFLAELGDKTQVATLLFASERKIPALTVFAASAGALVTGAAFTVLVGSTVGHYLHVLPLRLIAGVGFLAIGLWTLAQHFAGE